MEETFTYDDMNRLTGITLKRPSGQDLHCAVTYDALGRMTSKQAVTESDNLGSWVTITDANGIAEQQMSFDAWGNRRDPQTWANYTTNDAFEEPMFDRGFTGHEHFYSFGLINMNGRMYDPMMSSFLSADRYVQNPWSAQGFNRYAYCMYNPLRLTDPTGWRPIGGGRGYTPNSSANAFDPYMFYGGRIPLEPRDLGLRELSTADPIITWMEENSLHGSSGNGSEPIIDPSNLTPSQKKAFESTVAYLTEHSPLFKILYNSLSDSEINYVLIIGETSDNLPAQYNLKDNSIIFRDDEALISILAVSEEMFHAYQLSENKSLYNSKEFNFEFEAKVAVFFIVNQLDIGYQNAEGTNFEKMNSFLTSNGLDVVVPPAHYIQTPFFLNGYKEGADYFQAWNLRNNYGNTNYKKATLQAPKSLFKLFTPFKP